MKRAVFSKVANGCSAVICPDRQSKEEKKKKAFPTREKHCIKCASYPPHTLQFMHLSLYTPSCPQLDSWAHRSCNGLVRSVIAACDFIIGGSAALGGGNSRRKQSICSALF